MSASRRDMLYAATAPSEAWRGITTCAYCDQPLAREAAHFRGALAKDTGGFRVFKLHPGCEETVRRSQGARDHLVEILRNLRPWSDAPPGGHA